MLPLKGIKVLDMSRVLAGPFCSMLLADMGAEVIKVENTIKGDETREWGPPFVEQDSLYFWSVNRNKSSVSINFKKDSGQKVIHDLATKCDVLIENFLPGTLKRYNLDYETIKKFNSNLIYCSITGFGQKGPMAHRPGYDIIAAGIGGLLHITGPEGGPPCRVGVAVTDLMTGMNAVSSILAGLIGRQNHGGCHIDCNLLSTQICMLFHIGANYLTDKIEASRIGTSHSALVPYRAFQTLDDRYFIIGAGNDNQFRELCSLIQLPELHNDNRFFSNAMRIKHKDALNEILERQFIQKDLLHWIDLFKDSSLANGPVNNLEQVFSNAQVQFLSDTLIKSWKTPTKNVSVPGFPFRNSEWATSTSPSQPPKLGEHTDIILNSLLNYSNDQIDELHQTGSIFVNKLLVHK